jgi:hypothetical protein
MIERINELGGAWPKESGAQEFQMHSEIFPRRMLLQPGLVLAMTLVVQGLAHADAVVPAGSAEATALEVISRDSAASSKILVRFASISSTVCRTRLSNMRAFREPRCLAWG